MIRLTDVEIEQLLTERKILLENYRELLQLTPKRGHREQNLNIDGTAGSAFRLILRQSLTNPLDFSVILGYRGLPRLFLLRRYDGKSHFHTNRLERQRFYDFHIHIATQLATQRYQEAGLEEDGFAQPSNSFTDFHSALRCLLTDCHFEWPQDPQGTLFSEFETL